MARGLKLHQQWKLINHTWVNDPNKPVSIYFDVCAAIAENIRLWKTVGVLTQEKTYRLNDKYICPEDDSGTSGCAYCEQLYCPYWDCERWATWLKSEVYTSHGTADLSQKREATPNCTLCSYSPVNFTIFNLNETGWEVGKKFGIFICKKEQTLVLCCIFNSS
jgi:hypothetical protein